VSESTGGMTVHTTVNGRACAVEIDPRLTLLDLLRDTLGLTGTKRGCEVGECGACTVLLDGVAVNACLVPAPQVEGRQVTTVEGLAPGDGLTPGGALSPLQEAFLDHEAVHCGFCTPGMLMSARDLLDHHAAPSERDIREAISGNLCRCSGYVQIVAAIADAAEREARAGGDPRPESED
jgi:aerobic-type carbon monoxide dehydrogenase small subunit (CoxS/CutS family)